MPHAFVLTEFAAHVGDAQPIAGLAELVVQPAVDLQRRFVAGEGRGEVAEVLVQAPYTGPPPVFDGTKPVFPTG